MIDLHLHFDGSIPVKTVWEQAKKQGICLPASDMEALEKYLVCPKTCKNLNEYLTCFDIPLLVLQTKEGIMECMYALLAQLEAEGMLYAEIRFAPQLHTNQGLSQEQVVQAVCQAIAAYPTDELKAQLILCCMRGDKNEKENMETVRLAGKYAKQGVCACDLAGAEALFQTKAFSHVFAYASSLGVPFTIHAGEADGPESIWDAVRFGAVRIGHGVRAIEDAALMEELRRRKIVLECCPTSNVQTKAVSGLQQHPIRDFLQKGIAVCVNTDNRTVSGTNISLEMRNLKEQLHITTEEEKILYMQAVNAAFLDEKARKKLRLRIQKALA